MLTGSEETEQVIPHTCANCGKSFVGTRRPGKLSRGVFCSRRCSALHLWRTRRIERLEVLARAHRTIHAPQYAAIERVLLRDGFDVDFEVVIADEEGAVDGIYDVKVGEHLLIELGEVSTHHKYRTHNGYRDDEKNMLAMNQGYTLVRLEDDEPLGVLKVAREFYNLYPRG